ncbi:MAG: hypothetical protein HKN12_03255, partial [Gemmatimonadetes bacterium]|nr:hypothetical protein [Gemmatimonadota bacterium]
YVEIAALRAADRHEEWTLRSGQVTADLDSLTWNGAVEARYRGLDVGTAFRGELNEALVLFLDSVKLRTPAGSEGAGDSAPGNGAEAGSSGTGEIRVDPATGRTVVRGVELRGDLGTWRLDAELNADGSATAQVEAAWDRSPVAGIRALLPDPAQRTAGETLETWSDQDSTGLRVDVSTNSGVNGRRTVETRADFIVPGPRHLRGLLPPDLDFDVDDWGPVHGRLDAALELDPARPGAAAGSGTLDLGATPWLTEMRTAFRVDGTRVALDTLVAALPGLAVRGSGAVDSAEVDARLEFDVPDRRFLRRLGAVPPDVAATVSGTATLRGAPANPAITLNAAGSLKTATLAVPRFELSVAPVRNGRPEREIRLDLPQGATAGTSTWDRIELVARVPAESLAVFPVRADVTVRGPAADADLTLHATQDADGTLVATLPALTLRMSGNELRAQGPPARLLLDPDGALDIRDLDLRGDLGFARMSGRVTPDSLDVTFDADVSVPAETLRELMPPESSLRRDGLGVRIAGAGRASGPWTEPLGELRGRVVALRDGQDLEGAALDVDARVTRERIAATVFVADFDLESVRPLLPEDFLAEGTVGLDLKIDGTRKDPRIDGTARVRGLRVSTADGIRLTADGEAVLNNTRLANPDVALTASGSVETPAASVPRFEVTVTRMEDRRVIALRLPEGARSGTTAWSEVALDAWVPADTLGTFPLHVEVDVQSPAVGAALTLDATRDSTGTVGIAIPELALRLRDQEIGIGPEAAWISVTRDGSLEIRNLDLRGEPGHFALNGSLSPDSVGLFLDTDIEIPPGTLREFLPPDLRPRAEDLTVAFRGSGSFDGARGEARGTLSGRVGLTRPGGEVLASTWEGRLLGRAEDGVPAGVSMTFGMERRGAAVATGRLVLPGRLETDPVRWVREPADEVTLSLLVDDADLARYRDLLPEKIDAEGTVRIELEAAGPPEEMRLDGTMKASDVRIEVEETSWIAAGADATLGGTTRALRVRGKFLSTSGVVELPPAPQQLHPTSGAALLWTADSLAAEGPPDADADADAEAKDPEA